MITSDKHLLLAVEFALHLFNELFIHYRSICFNIIVHCNRSVAYTFLAYSIDSYEVMVVFMSEISHLLQINSYKDLLSFSLHSRNEETSILRANISSRKEHKIMGK